MNKILVVDDDLNIRNLISLYLKNDGYDIKLAADGTEAIDLVENTDFDLIILDIMMPKLNGFETCLEIRKNHNMPIIFLSAKDEDVSKIEGLTLGADDYVTKPFNSMELLARVKAHLRRRFVFNDDNRDRDVIRVNEMTINVSTHKVMIGEDEVKLTPKEFEILKTLAMNKGVVFSVEKLYETVWKESFAVSDTSIVVHITNLRQKIEKNPKSPDYIKTIWGVGYKI